MRLREFLLSLLVLASTVTTAAPGEITDLASEAEAKLQAGKAVEALEDLRKAVRRAHNQSALAFRKALFVAEPPGGFGIYKPRPNAVFKKGEPLVAYVEPVGVGWEKKGPDTYHALLTADFEVRNLQGDILAGKRDFGNFEFTSMEENTEIMTKVTLNLTGAPAGKFILGVIYHDKTTGKQATLELPFEIK